MKTGSNSATLSAVLEAVRPLKQAHAGSVLERAAGEAIDGARGNSGAILAQFLQGERSADGWSCPQKIRQQRGGFGADARR